MDATLANRWRPITFFDVVGQGGEVEVLKKVVNSDWRPPALVFTGPFGTGKTTLGRLTARALLCDNRSLSRAQLAAGDLNSKPYEPCGVCDSCKAMTRENHPNYIEVDAASQGSIADIRLMKDEVSYRAGNKVKIICYDEAHMLSQAAQNALLLILEEGRKDLLFMFCTTEANKMLGTVRSRCVELQMKLLTPAQIENRLVQIALAEGLQYEGRALKTIASYVRGHARDALGMLEQMSRVANPITEELVRKHLKLDRYVEIYKLLCEDDTKEGVQQIEQLLCNFSPSELTENLGEVLVNAYKVHLGIETFVAVDQGWMKKVLEKRDPTTLLTLAEAVLSSPTDYATINYGIACLGRLLFENITAAKAAPMRTLRATGSDNVSAIPSQFRKPPKQQ